MSAGCSQARPERPTPGWRCFIRKKVGWAWTPLAVITLPPAWDYVKLAVGRDYTDVSPINGSFLSKGGSAECAAAASVRFGESEPVLDDALQLLESAYVVQERRMVNFEFGMEK